LTIFSGGNQPQQQQMPRNDVMQALMRTLGQQQPQQQSHLQANPMDQCAEILKRPEAQTILNGLVNGEVNHFQLHQQMLSPNLSQRQREVIQAVLAVCKNSPRVGSPNLMIPPIGGAPIPIPPPIGSAGPAPGDMQPHLLFQHHAQKQQMRLSPLPNGEFGFHLSKFFSGCVCVFSLRLAPMSNNVSLDIVCIAFSVPSAAAVPPTNNPLTLHIPGEFVCLLQLEFSQTICFVLRFFGCIHNSLSISPSKNSSSHRRFFCACFSVETLLPQ
jgi:hypothetical protein